MVVDDSLTVRKITGRLLEREGYTRGHRQGRRRRPRADVARPAEGDAGRHRDAAHGRLRPGAQRARRRAHRRASRSSSSRRARRRSTATRRPQLGVNHFLGKPYGEAELLQLVARYAAMNGIEDRAAAAGDHRQVPGDPRDRQRRHQPRLPRARPFAERDVAIKVLDFARGADAESERLQHKAFVAEASLAGKLNHPHIVDIYDAVVEPDRSYLVMEYVAGSTLEKHAARDRLLPIGKVVEIIFKCIRALEYAHQHGIIHRDIKPGNILLSADGETKVSRLRRLVPAAPRGQDHADQGHRLAGVHVARAAAPGAAQPADRHLFARRDHVPPAHRAAAVRGGQPRRAHLRHPQHAAAEALEPASRPAAAARRDRAQGDRQGPGARATAHGSSSARTSRAPS